VDPVDLVFDDQRAQDSVEPTGHKLPVLLHQFDLIGRAALCTNSMHGWQAVREGWML
jgi:hypothetical protein